MNKWVDSIENAALIKKERKEFKLRIKFNGFLIFAIISSSYEQVSKLKNGIVPTMQQQFAASEKSVVTTVPLLSLLVIKEAAAPSVSLSAIKTGIATAPSVSLPAVKSKYFMFCMLRNTPTRKSKASGWEQSVLLIQCYKTDLSHQYLS